MMADTLVPSGPLIMPEMRWPTTCSRMDCAHLQCISWRKQARTLCHVCEQSIAAGSEYREYRDPLTQKLYMQEHVSCPKVQP